jgi:PAS domain S-box-containing protein
MDRHKQPYVKLKVAYLVTVITVLAFLSLFFIIGIETRNTSYQDSKLLAIEVSRKAAFETQVYLSSALMTARSIEQRVLLLREFGGDRSRFIEILKNSLHRNQIFMGAWTMWEPNAFDGKDKLFVNDTIYDSNGTMSVCFFKYKEQTFYERNEPEDFFENFYTIPRQTKKEIILDPYYYQYHNHPYTFYQTSAVVPLIENDTFLGVIGIDIELESISAKFKKVNLYKTGYLSLITNSGIIISHADTSYINKQITDILNHNDTVTYASIKKGLELAIETRSEFTNKKVFRFFYPIKVGSGIGPWSMMVEIPINEVTFRSRQLVYLAFGTLFLGVSLIVFLVLTILDRRKYEETIYNQIRQLKESNSLLAESEEKYKTLVETSQDGISLMDIQGNMLFVNNRKAQMVKAKNVNDLIGNNAFMLLTEQSRTKINELMPEMLKNGFMDNIEAEVQCLDGTVFSAEFNVTIIKGPDNLPKYIMDTMRDITLRKNSENALKESEERYRQLIESFPDIIMVSNLEGKIIYGNPALEKYTGIRPEDYGNPLVKAHIHPEDREMVSNELKKLLQGNQSHTGIIENRFIDADGKLHWFSGIMAKVFLKGELAIQTISRDITEKKEIEQELEKYRNHLENLVRERTDELEAINEELKMSNEELLSQRETLEETLNDLKKAQAQLIQNEKMASLGILAAGVAHEINNPLNFISAGIFGLESYVQDNLPTHKQKIDLLLNAIQTGVSRASAIVTSLSHYSRRDDLPQTECDIHQIIDNCLMMLQNQLKNKVEIIKNYTKTPVMVKGSEGKLHQAFLNILANSEHAIEKSGKIQIETKRNGEEIHIIFSDNGSGIDSRIIHRIMDPFFTTKPPGKGTGLGLSITYNIIKEHHGEIQIHSIKGKGTKVAIILQGNN